MTELTPNLRDVGRLVTESGHEVVSGRLLRSAVPRTGDRGLAGVQWPPSVVIDLRSATELEPAHPFAAHGAEIVHMPLLAALRPDTPAAQSLAELYLIMIDQSRHRFVDLVRVVGKAPGATLIHCAAGKDRTGVSIALLLRLVGVPRQSVLEDYELTAAATAAIDARLRPPSAEPGAHTYPPGFGHVAPEALTGVLDVWDSHDGGIHGWFAAAGGAEVDVLQLRRTLLA